MNEDQKSKYKSLEQVDKERYQKEKVEWESTNKTPVKPKESKKPASNKAKVATKEETKVSKAPITKSATQAPKQVEKLDGAPK